MFRGHLSLGILSLLAVSCLSVGCLSNKKDEVAVEAADPPPAAYPSTPEGYADTSMPTQQQAAPAPAPAPEPPKFELHSGETLVSYRIESGDNLTGIASKYNTSVSRIMAANGMTDTKIYAGRSLQIPVTAPAGLAMNAPSPPSSTGSYPSSTGSFSRAATAPSAPASSGGYQPSSPAPSISYPSPENAASPSSTSYERTVPSPPIPPQAQQPAGAFPTPTFSGSGGVQFSE